MCNHVNILILLSGMILNNETCLCQKHSHVFFLRGGYLWGLLKL